MGRIRVSTTVDEGLLTSARAACNDLNDASLLDAALQALLRAHRTAEVDAGYAAYDRTPLDAPDEWGDLASFGDAASVS